MAADFVHPDRAASLKAARGDDKTFASESRAMRLATTGDSMVASVARSGQQAVLDQPGESSSYARAGLAKEFNVASVRVVPCTGGVLVRDEGGMPRGSRWRSTPCCGSRWVEVWRVGMC